MATLGAIVFPYLVSFWIWQLRTDQAKPVKNTFQATEKGTVQKHAIKYDMD